MVIKNFLQEKYNIKEIIRENEYLSEDEKGFHQNPNQNYNNQNIIRSTCSKDNDSLRDGEELFDDISLNTINTNSIGDEDYETLDI